MVEYAKNAAGESLYLAVSTVARSSEPSMFKLLFLYTVIVLAAAAGVSLIIYLIARFRAWVRSKK